ncbi:MAG: YebC/PmpR family DNA-binding transcriptional regulator [Candidatus Caenarcaniphilales bacterium]|nr:YebC/PmpR family DNA-binding transcriptional regulator [Candidatus Caenarcaniphilales bacterium]
MAGHSKWANIKHRKQVMDGKKAAANANLSKEISVAARLGGSDPAFNFRLRNAIDRAKIIGVPNDNIQRAIDKSKGAHADGFEEIIYEAYGPGGTAIIIEAGTNNRNRTAAEIRLILGKYEGKLGESGCVSWGFNLRGVIYCPKDEKITEDFMLNLIINLSTSSENINLINDSEHWILTVPIESYEAVVKEIQNKIDCTCEISYIATNEVFLKNPDTIEKFEKLIESLEDNEDVQKVFHNASVE